MNARILRAISVRTRWVVALAAAVLAILGASCATGPSALSSGVGLSGLVAPAAPDPEASLATEVADWYKDANFYHLWVASFADSDGNGLGDIKGITGKLDYLKDLGVNALWLSPFFKSASNESNLHGYDATDLTMVDPRLGSNEDLRELLQAAHERGMRVIFDFVPNHVSSRHPWFTDSKAGRNGKRNWFVWREEQPSSGWKVWNGSSGFRRGGTDSFGDPQWYYAIFWDGMPDLNYRNPEVRAAMAGAARSWLDFGFDGIRMDAVRYLVESKDGSVNGVSDIDPDTYAFFQEFRKEILDPYADLGYPKFMVAENWGADKGSFEGFMLKDGKRGFQMSLDFGFGNQAYEAVKRGAADYLGSGGLEELHAERVAALHAKDAWTGTFLNNHDNYQSRPASAFPGDRRRIALAAALQYTGLGTPFWYYGNELEMLGQNNGDDRQFRTKLDWTVLDAVRADTSSTWHAVRALMGLRASRASLRRGDFLSLETGSADVIAFLRTLGDERTLVAFNLGEAAAEASIPLEATALNPLLGGSGASLVEGALSYPAMPALSYAVWSLD